MRELYWSIQGSVMRDTHCSRSAVAALACACLLAFPVRAEQQGDFFYSLANGEATITGYAGSGGDVTHYDRGMKQYVFDGCVSIRELVLDMPTVPRNFGSGACSCSGTASAFSLQRRIPKGTQQ
jgi:hypothetical protein